jgi:hypothetical protein
MSLSYFSEMYDYIILKRHTKFNNILHESYEKYHIFFYNIILICGAENFMKFKGIYKVKLHKKLSKKKKFGRVDYIKT